MTHADVWAAALEWAAEMAETFARAADAEGRKKLGAAEVDTAVGKAMRTMAGVYRADATRVPLHIDDDKTPPVGMVIPRKAR